VSLFTDAASHGDGHAVNRISHEHSFNSRGATRLIASPILSALLLLSGAAALGLQVLWARDFSLLLGATAEGTAVVLAAYFTGLMGGSEAGGRLARRAPGARLYALVELGAGFATLAYVVLLRPALPDVTAWMTRELPGAFLPTARAAFAFAVLLPPTFLIGASLPAAVSILPFDAVQASRLYAVNTLGGAAGTLLLGLGAVRVLGVRGAFLFSSALQIGVAVLALALARARPATLLRSVEASSYGESSSARARPLTALVITFLVGGAGLASEVLWTRGLSSVLSSSVYSVAIVLAAVLLGLVLGALVAARLLRSRFSVARSLAVACVLLAATTLTSRFAIRRLPDVALRIADPGHGSAATTGVASEVVLGLLVVLVPALCLGAIFPLCLSLAGRNPGETIGRLLAANTLGGAVGALGAAFVLLPALGLGGGLAVTAGLAAVAAVVSAEEKRARLALVALVTVGGFLAARAPALEVPWSGRFGAEELRFYRDGAAATVLVTADARGQKRLRVNGQYSLGGTDGVLLERRQAHLPLLLHADPERALLLGVGTGATLGAALAHPGLAVDGVELIPEVLEASALFADENEGMSEHPRARLLVDDARRFLRESPERWDVIVSDLFLPWTAGTAHLYSTDFYRIGREHLLPHGLYAQWLPLHQMSVEDLRAVIASFATVFPEVELWIAYHRTTAPLAVLIGATDRIAPDARELHARLTDDSLGPAASANGLGEADAVALLYLADGASLRAATTGVPPITDDDPYLEFTAPAAYFDQVGLGREALEWISGLVDPGPGAVRGAEAGGALRRHLLEAQLALLRGEGPAELRAYLAALEIAPRSPTVRRALLSIAASRRSAGDASTAAYIANALAQR